MYRLVRFPYYSTCIDRVKKKMAFLTFKNVIMQDIRVNLNLTRISL